MSETKHPTPGPIELYILATGLLLGILAGPAVLGRVAPAVHANLFGGGPATQQLVEYEEETAAMIAALQATGVTPAAVGEQLEMRALQGEAIRQARAAVMDRNALMKVFSVLLVLIGVMAIEAAFGRGGRAWSFVRYPIASLGLALLIARPGLMLALPSAWVG